MIWSERRTPYGFDRVCLPVCLSVAFFPRQGADYLLYRSLWSHKNGNPRFLLLEDIFEQQLERGNRCSILLRYYNLGSHYINNDVLIFRE